MRPKQREAFDLLTLQLMERGYIRTGPAGPPEWDGRGFLRATPETAARALALLQAEAEALALQRQRDAAAGLSRPGSWFPVHSSRIDILDDRGRWQIQVVAPYYEDGDYENEDYEDGLEDYLGCKIAAFGSWLDDGEVIVWEGLDQALQWAEDLAAARDRLLLVGVT